MFKSTHGLDFEAAPYHTQLQLREGYFWVAFKIGTVNGLYSSDALNYIILAVTNDQPGNGHFEDVFDWFEASCKRDSKNLIIAEVWNKKLKKHLLKKRGFIQIPEKKDDVIKIIN